MSLRLKLLSERLSEHCRTTVGTFFDSSDSSDNGRARPLSELDCRTVGDCRSLCRSYVGAMSELCRSYVGAMSDDYVGLSLYRTGAINYFPQRHAVTDAGDFSPFRFPKKNPRGAG